MGNCLRSSIRALDPTLPLHPHQHDMDKGTADIKNETIVHRSARNFTLSELEAVTMNFRCDTLIGEGGFGHVFRGWVDDKTFEPSKVGVGLAVAVKKAKPESYLLLQRWKAEIEFLETFRHQNLVKLVGYCSEENQFLTVYEYMDKGSLADHLFCEGPIPEPLSWERRLKIAIGAATGLAFLHSLEKSVIYRDVKSSNILLDGAYNAKLSNFGLATYGPTNATNGDIHVSTEIMGTYGYAAPEYLATGHLYVKSDVYGFGVVLLEILTGLRVIDAERPSNKVNLVEWTRPYISEKRKLKSIMDPKLEKNYSIKGAALIARLISKCLNSDHTKRPSMEQVLHDLYDSFNVKDKPKN